MKTTFTKITATSLAVLTAAFSFCFSSFAAEKQGGAEVRVGSAVTHYEDLEEAWDTAMDSKEPVTIKLLEDWKADANGSFGDGKYFYGGAIGIFNRSNDLTLDLNGNTIDRGLTEAREYGCVFYVEACKNITITDTSEAKTGVITGGYSKNNGGAFAVEGGKFTVSNVTVKGNKTNGRGGAFMINDYEVGTANKFSDVTVDNCTITENSAKTGGAIYIEATNHVNIFDSEITKNSAEADGGVHTEVSGLVRSFITLGGKVIIADNTAEKDGEGLMLDENLLFKVYVEYDEDRPLTEGSRIVVLSKTSDKTLRITDDSDFHNIDCFEYENDSYEIVAKGSGAKQYLDIRKN